MMPGLVDTNAAGAPGMATSPQSSGSGVGDAEVGGVSTGHSVGLGVADGVGVGRRGGAWGGRWGRGRSPGRSWGGRGGRARASVIVLVIAQRRGLGWGRARRWGGTDPVTPVGTGRRGRTSHVCPGTRPCVRLGHRRSGDHGPVSRAGSRPYRGRVVGSRSGTTADGDAVAVAAGISAPWGPGGDSTVARSKPRSARSASRRISTGRALSTTTNDPTMSTATATVNRSAVGRPWGRAPTWRRRRASAGRSGDEPVHRGVPPGAAGAPVMRSISRGRTPRRTRW